MEQLMSPQALEDLKLDTLLQLLAVFVHRFGGEVVVSQREFDMVEGCDVLGSNITPNHLRLRLDDGFLGFDDSTEPPSCDDDLL